MPEKAAKKRNKVFINFNLSFVKYFIHNLHKDRNVYGPIYIYKKTIKKRKKSDEFFDELCLQFDR